MKDETNGDHSFKQWASLMNKNGYIWRFVVAFIIVIVELCNFQWIIDTANENFSDSGAFGVVAVCIACLIPVAICALIGYLGFWKFWREYTGRA
jgi:uncharacterized membrane protein YcjF (UPF0283 family)